MEEKDSFKKALEYDPSLHARGVLDRTIEEKENRERGQVNSGATEVKVSEARSGDSLADITSNRTRARVLYISTDESLLVDGSARGTELREIAELFSEVHVLVLRKGVKKRDVIERKGHNIWIYGAATGSWWRTILYGESLLKEQLGLVDGFRADLIIAEDPYDCGVLAEKISAEFGRPFILEVRDDIFSRSYASTMHHRFFRKWMARNVFNSTSGVRTKSEYLKARVIEKYKHLRGVTEVLPTYYNIDAWQKSPVQFDLHARYTHFKFILLHFSLMDEESYTETVLEGLTQPLRSYSSLGLVVLGDGPARSSLKRFIANRGIVNQVVFEDMPANYDSHIHTADALIHTSQHYVHERCLIEAAAVGLPILASVEGLPGELFLDGQSALLCPLASPPCFSMKVKKLNDYLVRKNISDNAKRIVGSTYEQDYSTYLEAYKASIERSLVGMS